MAGSYKSNQYYQGDSIVTGQVDNKNQFVMRSQNNSETDHEVGTKKAGKNKKSCKDKCCGPPLWILLGLLALAAIVLGLLFALGVLGGHHQDSDPSVIINGVEYPQDSISVETTYISKS